jgi:hypothetical protein
MTLPAVGDEAVLDAQRMFHLNAGVDAVVAGLDEAAASDADWILPARAGEFWWPRGGTLSELLSAIPDDYDIVQALVRPFLAVEGGDAAEMTYRLSAQAMLDDPRGSARPARRLAYRPGVDLSSYDGEIPKAALRPLRGWYPIEVFALSSAPPLAREELERGIDEGVIQVDTRLRDALRAIRAGEELTFPRPTVAENAWFAVDAAVLGEADTLRVRREIDDLERRLAGLEENLGVRVERKLRSLLRGGRRQA